MDEPAPQDIPFESVGPSGGPTPLGAGGCGLGMTRVSFDKGGHRFEFRCDPGHEASLARCVMEMARDRSTPMEPGDAFALCRQILSLSTAGGESAGSASQDVSAKPRDGESRPTRRNAA